MYRLYRKLGFWLPLNYQHMIMVPTNQRVLSDHLKTKRRSARNDLEDLFD